MTTVTGVFLGAFRGMATGLAVLCLACSGSGLVVVPRHPFVEDSGLSLIDETLTLRVLGDGCVAVDALFDFASHGGPLDRVATFPIGAPRGPAVDFSAALVGGGPVPVARGAPGALPMGDAIEHWDLFLDGSELERHGGRLRVRYVQPGRGEFGYVLRSGAYWAGPIRHLRLILEDPFAKVATLIVEGQHISTTGRPKSVIDLRDLEPRSGVRLLLK